MGSLAGSLAGREKRWTADRVGPAAVVSEGGNLTMESTPQNPTMKSVPQWDADDGDGNDG